MIQIIHTCLSLEMASSWSTENVGSFHSSCFFIFAYFSFVSCGHRSLTSIEFGIYPLGVRGNTPAMGESAGGFVFTASEAGGKNPVGSFSGFHSPSTVIKYDINLSNHTSVTHNQILQLFSLIVFQCSYSIKAL